MSQAGRGSQHLLALAWGSHPPWFIGVSVGGMVGVFVLPPTFYGHPGCDKIAEPPPICPCPMARAETQNAQNSTEVRPIELIPAWRTRRGEIDHALSEYAISQPILFLKGT